MDVLVITNSGAGSGEQETVDRALEVLRAGAEVEVASTSDASELRAALEAVGDRVIVVAGGDGSLHAAVSALYAGGGLADATVALIPLGTGNDFARGNGIPLPPEEAAAVVLHGERRPVDLITDDAGGVVVNNVHAGASAQASRRADRWKRRLSTVKLGKLGYPVGTALAAFRPPFVRLTIEVDGHTVADPDHPLLMVSIGNSSHIGGGTEVTPDATPEDGRADVMVSFAVGPLSRFGYTWKLRQGEHQERDDVLSTRGRRVSVHGEEFYVSADGEIDGPMHERTWEVRPGAFHMLLPTDQQAIDPEDQPG